MFKNNIKKTLVFLAILVVLGAVAAFFFSPPTSWSPQSGKITGDSATEKLSSLASLLNQKQENQKFLHISFVNYNSETDIWYFSIFVMERYKIVFGQEGTAASTVSQTFWKTLQDLFVEASKIISPPSEKMVAKVIFEDTVEGIFYINKVSAILRNPSDLTLYLNWLPIGMPGSEEKEKELAPFINPYYNNQ